MVARARPRSSAASRPRRRVDLAAHVGVEVEQLALDLRRERVRARGHGLRAEGLGRPRVRHLACDDALQVGLERGGVHDAEETLLDGDLELAAEEAPVEGERRGLPRTDGPGEAARTRPVSVRKTRPGLSGARRLRRCFCPFPSTTVNGTGDERVTARLPSASRPAPASCPRPADVGPVVVVREDLLVVVPARAMP